MTHEPLRGHCHRGDVRFTVTDGVSASACHGDDCRKSHGNDMAFLAAPVASVKVEGAEHLTWYDSSDHGRRGFCRHCGGRLFKAVGEGCMVGAIEGPTGLRFVQHLWVESKGDGYDVPEVEVAR